jgi:EAL domain-containing protein (putative c-di-GMP-specific phosphodiesterase class I)
VQAIITMAHTLGYKVVAEGVETEKQVACLLGLRCDLFQGYLLSRPVAPVEIPALLATRHSALAMPKTQADALHLVSDA